MSSADRKLFILHHLASLLNLSPTDDEDYVSEILDQLSSIENPEDVSEYLGNFVTDESSGNVNLFVEELERFKSGEDVAVAISEEHPVKIENPSTKATQSTTIPRILDEGAAQREEIRLRELEAREKQREEQERLRQKKLEEERLRKAALQSKHDNEHSLSKRKNRDQAQVHTRKSDVPTLPLSTSKPEAQRISSSPKDLAQYASVRNTTSKPLKGVPKVVCGCFGNKHPPLTNCLHCGRISCEREGYDYCPFCNNIITQFTPNSDSKSDSAMAHKERLLEYDRTSASRTHVHDDQEDYFVTQSSMWSSTQEQNEASILEEERRKKLHQRGNQVLDLEF